MTAEKFLITQSDSKTDLSKLSLPQVALFMEAYAIYYHEIQVRKGQNKTALELSEKGIECRIIPVENGVRIHLQRAGLMTEPVIISNTELEHSSFNQVDYMINKLIEVLQSS